jgi:hypothetical protein
MLTVLTALLKWDINIQDRHFSTWEVYKGRAKKEKEKENTRKLLL